MTGKQKRRAQLLSWRRDCYSDVSAKALAESLSCEKLPYEQFRHLRYDTRYAACRRFIVGQVRR